MMQELRFVVIDFHTESRFLLVKTLRRKFPEAEILETDDADKAIAIAKSVRVAAIVTHRTFEVEGVQLVRLLREADGAVPIVMVSGIDRGAEALRAGADCFLPYEEWLRIGSVVEAYLQRNGGSATSSPAAHLA